MSTPPRIVSLLPSATEIVVALGLADQLVGRSHECDFPAWVESLPVCTATKLEKGLTSLEIDNRVLDIVSKGLSVYDVDADLLRGLRPDVIITQSQCAVCAVTPRDLEQALAAWIGRAPVLVSLAPDDLLDVWADVRRVGEAVGAGEAADRTVDQLLAALEDVRSDGPAAGDRPSVAAIEWIEPLMAAGNWVPELVDMAGGRPLFAKPGEHSPWLDWDELAEADPDLIIFMPCGYRIEQTNRELPRLAENARWAGLKAVRGNRVFVADGHHFFNRPGPRLVESCAIIADIISAPETKLGCEMGRWQRAATE